MRVRAVAFAVVSLAVAVLVTPLAPATQPPGRVPRIGVLRPGSPEPDPYLDVLRQSLRDLGYVEGQTLALEVRWAREQRDQLPRLAAELVRLPVDLLVVAGTAATRAAQQATRRTPIVMVAVGDPVTSGFVAARVRPGGNITGLTLLHPEVAATRLAILTELLPAATRVAVLRNPATVTPSSPIWRATEITVQALGMRLEPVDVREPNELAGALAVSRARADALIVLPDPMFTQYRERIVELAASHLLPAIYEGREFVEAGGLLSYAPSIRDQYRRAATYVDKILKGADPAELGIEEPFRFELVVNRKTAEALGLTIPPKVLARATEILW